MLVAECTGPKLNTVYVKGAIRAIIKKEWILKNDIP